MNFAGARAGRAAEPLALAGGGTGRRAAVWRDCPAMSWRVVKFNPRRYVQSSVYRSCPPPRGVPGSDSLGRGWPVRFLFRLAARIQCIRVVLLPSWRNRALRQRKGLLDALFRSLLGIGLAVAVGQRGLVLRDRLVPLREDLIRIIGVAGDVVHPAEIDVGPGNRAWVVGELDGLGQMVERLVRVPFHQVDATQYVVRLGIRGIGLQI